VTFDQAYLIAAYKKNAIPINNTKKVADWLNKKGTTTRTQKKWFNILVLNKMIFPERQSRQNSPRDSLNYTLANFVNCCKEYDFTNQEWITRQRELVDEDIVQHSYFYLKKVARTLGIRLSTRKTNDETRGEKK
jgi:hypothetical protein